jgi:hypothetical protein
VSVWLEHSLKDGMGDRYQKSHPNDCYNQCRPFTGSGDPCANKGIGGASLSRPQTRGAAPLWMACASWRIAEKAWVLCEQDIPRKFAITMGKGAEAAR